MATKVDGWRLEDSGPQSGNLIRAEIRDGDAVIAELPCPDAHPEYGISRKQWAANANLLAAAPYLLVSLREMVGDLKAHASLGLNDREIEMLKRAEDAIAKATGS